MHSSMTFAVHNQEPRRDISILFTKDDHFVIYEIDMYVNSVKAYLSFILRKH